MEQTYKYDAFISYRHAELDIKVAELLHTKLETFKTPKGFKKIERVFRDRDELPTSSNLADSILEALTHSKYLIVICSPRTGLSKWVLKEIEIFRELHGNNRILTILIEGEPDEAFPDSLRLIPYTTIDDSGEEKLAYEVVEPLAADIRDKSFKGMKKKLNTEILRLMAPLYGCKYDDLKQRQKKRVKNQLLLLTTVIAILAGLIGFIGFWQIQLLEAQKEQVAVNERLLNETSELLDQTKDQLSEKNDADVITSLNDNGVYIGSGHDLWREGLPEDSFLITDFLAADFVISDKDNKYLITNETYDSLYIFDFNTRELLFSLPYEDDDYIGATFIPDRNQVVVLTDETASLFNLDTFTIEKEYKNEDAHTISPSNDGTYLVDIDNYNETVNLINPLTMTVINSYTNEGYGNSAEFSKDNLYTFVLNDESLLSIHLESGNTNLFPIDEYSNVAIDNYQNYTAIVKDSKVIVYDYSTGQEVYQSDESLSKILSLSFLPKGKGLLTSNEDRILHHLNLTTFQTEVISTTLNAPISHYIYNNDETFMVTWDLDSEQAMIWNLDQMKEIAYVPYFFGISPDFKTVYGYEAFNLYGMNRESLENNFNK